MNENKLKKLIWAGLSIISITFIIMISLILISNPIPDLVMLFFDLGVVVTAISSIALAVIKKRNRDIFRNFRQSQKS